MCLVIHIKRSFRETNIYTSHIQFTYFHQYLLNVTDTAAEPLFISMDLTHRMIYLFIFCTFFHHLFFFLNISMCIRKTHLGFSLDNNNINESFEKLWVLWWVNIILRFDQHILRTMNILGVYDLWRYVYHLFWATIASINCKHNDTFCKNFTTLRFVIGFELKCSSCQILSLSAYFA